MTVAVKKRLSVPESITKKAGIKPGDVVEFTVRDGAITIRPAVQVEERSYPTYTPTKSESAAIRRGRAAYERGDYLTLNQLQNELDAGCRRPRKKVTRQDS